MYRYSSEVINTGNNDIDTIASDKNFDINNFNVLLETGDRFLLEYYSESCLVLESYQLNTILPNTQNENFTSEISVLDFSETNPFGEINA